MSAGCRRLYVHTAAPGTGMYVSRTWYKILVHNDNVRARTAMMLLRASPHLPPQFNVLNDPGHRPRHPHRSRPNYSSSPSRGNFPPPGVGRVLSCSRSKVLGQAWLLVALLPVGTSMTHRMYVRLLPMVTMMLSHEQDEANSHEAGHKKASRRKK